jgi:hypothetical protein
LSSNDDISLLLHAAIYLLSHVSRFSHYLFLIRYIKPTFQFNNHTEPSISVSGDAQINQAIAAIVYHIHEYSMSSNPETVQISTAVNKSAEIQGPFPMVVDGGTTEEGFLPAQSSQAEYFPGWRKLSVIMLSLYLCMFLVALVGSLLYSQLPFFHR